MLFNVFSCLCFFCYCSLGRRVIADLENKSETIYCVKTFATVEYLMLCAALNFKVFLSRVNKKPPTYTQNSSGWSITVECKRQRHATAIVSFVRCQFFFLRCIQPWQIVWITKPLFKHIYYKWCAWIAIMLIIIMC